MHAYTKCGISAWIPRNTKDLTQPPRQFFLLSTAHHTTLPQRHSHPVYCPWRNTKNTLCSSGSVLWTLQCHISAFIRYKGDTSLELRYQLRT